MLISDGGAYLHVQAAAQSEGYHSQSLRDSQKIVYAIDVYSESPPRKLALPASMKCFKDKLEADIDVLSAHSSDPYADGLEDSRRDCSMVHGIRAWQKETDGQAP